MERRQGWLRSSSRLGKKASYKKWTLPELWLKTLIWFGEHLSKIQEGFKWLGMVVPKMPYDQGRQDEAIQPICRHIWRIDEANGHYSKGCCQRCGEVKRFSNWLADSDFLTKSEKLVWPIKFVGVANDFISKRKQNALAVLFGFLTGLSCRRNGLELNWKCWGLYFSRFES